MRKTRLAEERIVLALPHGGWDAGGRNCSKLDVTHGRMDCALALAGETGA